MKDYLYRVIMEEEKGLWPEILKCLLWVLSGVYGGLVRFLRFCYSWGIFSQRCLAKPVVSIGNITLGGTGKTPLVQWLLDHCQRRGVKPVVLTRGYMAEKRAALSDEVAQLKENFLDVPLLAGRDRVKLGEEAIKTNPVDMVILDDGFQHWRLKRDLDIVVIDSTNPFGNGFVLPRGILREPFKHLARASLFVLSKTDMGRDHLGPLKERLHQVNPRATIIETIHEPVEFVNIGSQERIPLARLKGQSACSLCAIGSPISFAATLKKAGVEVKKQFAFPDHHLYSWEDFKRVLDFCRVNAINRLITTHKDSVKIQTFLGDVPREIQFSYLSIRLKIIQGEDEILRRIFSLCGR